MKPETRKVSKRIIITSDIAKELKQVSTKLGISKTDIIKRSIIEYLSNGLNELKKGDINII